VNVELAIGQGVAPGVQIVPAANATPFSVGTLIPLRLPQASVVVANWPTIRYRTLKHGRSTTLIVSTRSSFAVLEHHAPANFMSPSHELSATVARLTVAYIPLKPCQYKRKILSKAVRLFRLLDKYKVNINLR
jgi:hypothetical protein